MSHVDLTPLPKEVLHGKETAVLFGISWAVLTPEDQMVRLLLIPREGVPIQAFFHRLTPLMLRDAPRPHHSRHWGPEELDIQDDHLSVHLEGVVYRIAQRMSASWSYFTDTHEF